MDVRAGGGQVPGCAFDSCAEGSCSDDWRCLADTACVEGLHGRHEGVRAHAHRESSDIEIVPGRVTLADLNWLEVQNLDVRRDRDGDPPMFDDSGFQSLVADQLPYTSFQSSRLTLALQ